MNSFSPYSKEQQLRGHQKMKDTPKFKAQRHKSKPKRKTKVNLFNGTQIPSRAKRGEFTVKQKMQIIDLHGNCCLVCGSPLIEFHHRKFRSQLGRNNPRNGAPLCLTHHKEAHDNVGFAQLLREEAIERFGEFYYYDRYDLYKENYIDRPTQELMDKFFEGEEEKCRTKNGTNGNGK
jgi:hypothetical protein